MQGLYSDQQGYDISYVSSSLEIIPAALTISTSNVSKTYDGSTTAAGTAVVSGNTILFGTDSLIGGNFAFTDKHAGNRNKTVTVYGVTVNDGNSGGNYTVTYASNTSSTITPKALAVTAQAASKTYGDADAALAYTTTGLVGSDTLAGNLTRDAGENVGSYAINQGSLANSNYNITFTGNALTITANNAQKQQGQTLNWSGKEFVANGLVRSEAISQVHLQSTGSPAEAMPGHYAIVASQAQGLNGFEARNYDVQYVDGDLQILATPAPAPQPPAPIAPVTVGAAEMVRQGSLSSQVDNAPDNNVGPNVALFATMSSAADTRPPLLKLTPNLINTESEE